MKNKIALVVIGGLALISIIINVLLYSNYNNLNSKAEVFQTEISSLNDSINQLNTQLADKDTDIASKNEEITTLSTKINELESSIETLQSENEDLLNQLDTLKSENEELKMVSGSLLSTTKPQPQVQNNETPSNITNIQPQVDTAPVNSAGALSGLPGAANTGGKTFGDIPRLVGDNGASSLGDLGGSAE